ncbi:MAG: chromosomal replication initiator DnaA [Xanthobacteraceae bacterium]|nr:chromosomal replication initiator DnaA [Xanthobacteraceae bacterium]PWB57096.1 MAG: chromosomal replication initiator DnaA [Bradyrhizobiaceae bacterium]
MTGAPRQLALALGHADSFAREDFLSGPTNAAALAMIERWPDWPGRALALVGPEGAGKSHLAAIWAAASGARFLAARALADADLPAALATGALVLEDAAPGIVHERSLFHLLNLAREEGAFLLLVARDPPARWEVRLPDLASRLRALTVLELGAPDDALLRAVIVKQFADRQLRVDEALLAYLATRMERSFAAARDIVAALDREALRRKRPLSRALAAELLRDDMP